VDEMMMMEKKKMTLGWAADGKKTPRWAAGGIDPLWPLLMIINPLSRLANLGCGCPLQECETYSDQSCVFSHAPVLEE